VTAAADVTVDRGDGLVARVLSTFGTRVLLTGVGALTGIIIARALGPTGRGQYAVIVSVCFIAVALGHLSLEQAHLYLWAELRERRRALVANACLLAGTVGTVAALVTGAAVLALGSDRVPVFSTTALVIALATIPVSLLVLWNNSLLLLAGRVSRYNRGMLLGALTQCALLIGLTVTGNISTFAVITVWAATSGLALLVSVPALRPRFRDLDPALAVRAVKTGLRYHAGFAAFVLLLRLDVLLLNGIVTPTQVGLYSVAVTMAELVWLFTDSLANAVVAQQADSDLADAARVTAAGVRFSIVGATVLSVGLGATSPFLLPLLYGDPFAPAVVPLAVLLPGVVCLAIARPVGAYLLRLNRPALTAGAAGTAALLNLVLLLVLVPVLGIVGASVAASAGYAVLAITYLGLFCHFTPDLRWRDFLPRRAELTPLVRRTAGAAATLRRGRR
jgi:O-antigen/teichoic acid export membrane protein